MIITLLLLQLSYPQLPSPFNASNAFASLGEQDTAIEKDRARYSARRADPEKHANFSVHELTTNGIKLREFTDHSGKIFAIKWNGNTHPDLAPLLGSYNNEYLNLLADEKDRRTSKTKMRVRTANHSLSGPNITIEKSGHLRNSQGRVYLLKNFPAGVSLNEIQ